MPNGLCVVLYKVFPWMCFHCIYFYCLSGTVNTLLYGYTKFREPDSGNTSDYSKIEDSIIKPKRRSTVDTNEMVYRHFEKQ